MLWKDRHFDTTVFVFSSEEKAVSYAKIMANKANRWDYLDEKMTPEMERAGWLYRGSYTPEGDGLRVERKILDDQEGETIE